METLNKETKDKILEVARAAFNAGYWRGFMEGQDQTEPPQEPDFNEWIKPYLNIDGQ